MGDPPVRQRDKEKHRGMFCAGDSLGAGEVYDNYRGESAGRTIDALIVDAAAQYADVLVSDDVEIQTRAPRHLIHTRVASVVRLLQELAGTDQLPRARL
jgi:hypothetical protein